MESSSSCIDQIEQAYPVGSYIDIYYWSDDPSNYEFQNLVGDEAFMYNCCAFFAIFAVSGIAMAFLGGNVKTSMATGGLAGRMGTLSANKQYNARWPNETWQSIQQSWNGQSTFTPLKEYWPPWYKERNYNL